MCDVKTLSKQMDKLHGTLEETNRVSVDTQLKLGSVVSELKTWQRTKCAAHDKAIDDLELKTDTIDRKVDNATRVANMAVVKATTVFVLINTAFGAAVAKALGAF